MYKYYFLLLASLSFSSVGLAQGPRFGATVLGQALAYSESFTLKQVLDDLKGGEKPASGNKAFMKLKAGVEYTDGQHGYGVYVRREALVKHSQGAADFLYLDKNHYVFPDPGYFDIQIDVDDIHFQEYQYRYQWVLNERVTLTPGISLIYADDLIKGRLNGHVSSANAFSGQEFSWDASLDYYYREDLLLDRPNVTEPVGYGYTSHLRLGWQLSPGIDLTAQVQDIVSAIIWQDAPFTQARSQVNGALSLRQPAVAGRVGYERMVQTIDPHISVEASLFLQAGSFFSARSESLFGQEFNYLGYLHRADDGQVLVRACLETHALELALSKQYLQLNIVTDSFDFNRAKHASLNLSAQMHF